MWPHSFMDESMNQLDTRDAWPRMTAATVGGAASPSDGDGAGAESDHHTYDVSRGRVPGTSLAEPFLVISIGNAFFWAAALPDELGPRGRHVILRHIVLGIGKAERPRRLPLSLLHKLIVMDEAVVIDGYLPHCLTGAI